MKSSPGTKYRSVLFTPKRLIVSVALLLGVMSNNSQAAIQAWDPNGTTSIGGNGIWDLTTANWTPAGTQSQTASLTVWNPVGTNAALFCAGPSGSASQGTFTITVNDKIPMGGVFNGPLTPAPCTVTFQGAGSFDITPASSGLAGFATFNSAVGNTYILIPIVGTSKVVPEYSGQLYLYGTNTYTGGTQFGHSSPSFGGIVNFNSSSSFGTGNLIISNTAGGVGALVYTGTSAVTVTNKITWSVLGGGLNIVGVPAGVTFNGTVAIAAAATNALLYSGGGNTNLVIMSGVISGGKAGGFLNKGNLATLRLSGANTHLLTTTVSNGVLQAGANGCIPSGSGKGDLIVAKNADAINVGTFDVNGFSVSCNGLSGDGIIDNNSTTVGTLTAGNNNVTSTFSGTIQSTKGGLNLTKAGTGTLTLLGNSTYSGTTTINGGTLVAFGGNANIPTNSPINIALGAILDVRSDPMLVSNLVGRGNIINNSFTLTVSNNFVTTNSITSYSGYSGGIDNGALDKEGTGAMSLRGTNNLINGVTVNGGTLSVGAGPDRIAVPGGANLTIGPAGTFQLDAASQTVSQLSGSGFINLGGGTLNVSTGVGNVYSGVIRDSDLGANSTAQGHGLRGYYYDNQDFSSLLTVRDDAQILFTNFTLPDELPAPIYPNTNGFSVRWVGQILAPATGSYTFSVAADDGIRLWVDGNPVIDGWSTGNSTRNGTVITLNENTRYDIVVEYFNQTGGANCTLKWTPPGDSVSSVVPTDYLFLPTPGSVVKDGAGSLQLTATSTYTGSTIVKGGTLEASANGALGLGNVIVQNGATLTLDGGNSFIADSADLVVNGSAVVNLNFSGTDTVRSFSTDGGVTYKASGVWGPLGSGAAHEDSHLSGTGRILVAGQPSTTTLGSSTGTSVYGSAVTLTAVAHGTGATPTGTITFFDGANAIGTVAVDGTGTAVLSVSDLLVTTSPHSVTAVYNGDGTYAPSTSAAVTQNVTPLTLTGVTGLSKVYDQTTTAPLNLTNLIGILPIDTNLVHLATNYTANFSDKNVGVNKPISASGISLTGSVSGNYTIASTANTTGSITPKILTATNVTASSKVYDGTTTATVNASSATITTNVTVYAGDDATPNFAAATGTFASATVGNNKTVTVTVPFTGADGADYIANGTATANITIGNSALALNSSANPANAGDNVSFTATASAVSPASGTPTGNVVFLTNGVVFATVPLSGGSANSGVTTTLPIGTTTVTAQYAGDANFVGSTNTLQQTINDASTQPPTLTVTKSANSITLSWTGAFILQSTPSLPASWQDVPGAASPYTTTITNAETLYRLRN
jgi:autotransporter-associated beta strand protein